MAGALVPGTSSIILPKHITRGLVGKKSSRDPSCHSSMGYPFCRLQLNLLYHNASPTTHIVSEAWLPLPKAGSAAEVMEPFVCVYVFVWVLVTETLLFPAIPFPKTSWKKGTT